jgi:hypothetical protein
MKEVKVFKSPHPPPTTQTHPTKKKKKKKGFKQGIE